jgi:hypothetical protein
MTPPSKLSPATSRDLALLASRLETMARQESPGPLPHLPHGILVFYEASFEVKKIIASSGASSSSAAAPIGAAAPSS